MPDPSPYLTLPEIRARIRRWCTYQDRSQEQTRGQLRDLGLEFPLAEEELSKLIQEGYVSDARFAVAYVRGHLSKGWGRQKIKLGLAAQGIPESLIESTLQTEIESILYQQQLDRLLLAKRSQLKERNPVRRNFKLLQHLEQKGYLRSEIIEALDRAGLRG